MDKQRDACRKGSGMKSLAIALTLLMLCVPSANATSRLHRRVHSAYHYLVWAPISACALVLVGLPVGVALLCEVTLKQRADEEQIEEMFDHTIELHAEGAETL